MDNLFKYIKVKALAWIVNGDKTFVVRMTDAVKGDNYYRSIGGSVEYGELACDAIVREAREELETEIEVTGEPLVLENIFVCDGKNGHEINFIYPCRFKDASYYEDKEYRLIEGDGKIFKASWVPLEDCRNGSLRLVPEQLLEWKY
jgi:8-oxo-dGTP pyrophosphatase MutT (NUDIX family)